MATKLNKQLEPSAMSDLIEKDNTLQNLPKQGEIAKGTVISVSKKEVLLDVGGVMTGIIRGKELYQEAEEFANLQLGEEAEATVLELENEQGMIELSFRFAGHQKTWATLQKAKENSETVSAKVKDANKGGLLVIINSVPGFLPVSQLSPEFYPRVQGGDKNKILEKLKSYVDQTFSVKIIDVDPESEKLIVSEKTAWEENQKEVFNKYNIDDEIEGTVTAVTDFGVFVEFGDNLEGLIHISELAWQRIDNPAELFKVGDKLKAKIIKIDGTKIFLSSKQLIADPWANIDKKYKLNDVIEGEIIKSTPFGLFVKLDDDIHGLAHISELSDNKVENTEAFQAGAKMKFRIVSIEPKEHRLGLSIKSLDKTTEELETEQKDKKQAKEAKKNETEIEEKKENEQGNEATSQ